MLARAAILSEPGAEGAPLSLEGPFSPVYDDAIVNVTSPYLCNPRTDKTTTPGNKLSRKFFVAE